MDRKWSVFEIAILVACVLLAVGALLVLRTYSPTEKIVAPTITIWGTLPQQQMTEFISELAKEVPFVENVRYVAFAQDQYYSRLLETFASGASNAPDLFLIDQAHFFEFENKVYDISESLPPNQFTNDFVEAAEVFLVGGAVRAVPFSIDPLVLYWNRDLFANAGIAEPPTTWTELITLVPKITAYETGTTLRQSAVALGTYDNIQNARAVLSALLLQSDVRIVDTRSQKAAISDLTRATDGYEKRGEAVLRYYSDFSNPTKAVYTWNLSRSSDRASFLDGTLGLYMGFASENELLKKSNPNLNFDVAPLLQRASAKRKVTYAHVYGFVVPKLVPHSQAQNAVQVARVLSSTQAIAAFTKSIGLPPVRRDLVAAPQVTTFGSVSYTSALIARSWLEPSSVVTDQAFGTMVHDVTTGASTPQSAIAVAEGEINAALSALQRR